MSDVEPASPCISVCLLDDDDVCVGCYRNAEEITDWFMASAEEKMQIIGRCRERMKAAQTIKLG